MQPRVAMIIATLYPSIPRKTVAASERHGPAALKLAQVIQFTAQYFGPVHKRLGLTDGFSNMESSLPPKARQANTRRLLRTAFLIYGIMVVGLLGFFIAFPGNTTHGTGTQGESAPLQTAAKAVRYEGVIANWNRYRNRDSRADAR